MIRRRTIGQLIRALRDRRGLTGEELGTRCNVTRGQIYNWEQSSRIIPKNLQPLARALDVPVVTLWEANGARKKIA